MPHLRFTAYGAPVTQGSVSAYPTKGGRGVRTVSKTPALIEWREIVRAAAVAAAGPDWETQDGAAKVHLAYFVPRPRSAPKTIDIWPTKGQDIDKLERAVFDAITNAGIWTDDSRVVQVVHKKRYAVGPDLPRIYKPGWHRVQPCVEVTIIWPGR